MFQIILACYEKNIGYVAAAEHEINAGDANSLDARQSSKECQDLCRLNKDCAIFIWNRINKSCKLLKDASNRILVDETISGPPVCRGETTFIVLLTLLVKVYALSLIYI